MPVTATIMLHSPQADEDSTVGEFNFVALPRTGDIVTLNGNREFQVVKAEHILEAGRPSLVVVFVDEN